MTRVLDDLEIYEANFNYPEHNVLGEFEFGVIVKSMKDDDEGRESFWIQIKPRLSDDEMVSVVCHELEHYDIAQALFSLNILTRGDLSYREGSDGIGTRPFKEWLHSNPSSYT